jgi:hypothetical protein
MRSVVDWMNLSTQLERNVQEENKSAELKNDIVEMFFRCTSFESLVSINTMTTTRVLFT